MDIEKVVYAEWAAKALELIPEEKKNELIKDALYRQLSTTDFRWHVTKIIEEYAITYAVELLADEEFQQAIKAKVKQTVDVMFETFARHACYALLGKLEMVASDMRRDMRRGENGQ